MKIYKFDPQVGVVVQAGTEMVLTPYGDSIPLRDMVDTANELLGALAEVLDSHGALGGASHELIDHGFTAERAKEICALVDNYYKED